MRDEKCKTYHTTRFAYLGRSDLPGADAHLLVLAQLHWIDNLVVVGTNVAHHFLVLGVLAQQTLHLACKKQPILSQTRFLLPRLPVLHAAPPPRTKAPFRRFWARPVGARQGFEKCPTPNLAFFPRPGILAGEKSAAAAISPPLPRAVAAALGCSRVKTGALYRPPGSSYDFLKPGQRHKSVYFAMPPILLCQTPAHRAINLKLGTPMGRGLRDWRPEAEADSCTRRAAANF